MAGPTWSPDGRQIAVAGNDLKGRHGLFRIDASTGAVTAITFTSSSPFARTDPGERLTYEGPMWSPDGARLYYHKANGAILEWTFATATAREIARGFGSIGLSPDGDLIAASRPDRRQLVVIPVCRATSGAGI